MRKRNLLIASLILGVLWALLAYSVATTISRDDEMRSLLIKQLEAEGFRISLELPANLTNPTRTFTVDTIDDFIRIGKQLNQTIIGKQLNQTIIYRGYYAGSVDGSVPSFRFVVSEVNCEDPVLRALGRCTVLRNDHIIFQPKWKLPTVGVVLLVYGLVMFAGTWMVSGVAYDDWQRKKRQEKK